MAECDPALTSSTVSELAEARRTTYLSGRWIWDDQNGETSISITGPPVTLPSNGDCSAYYSWVEEKRTNQGPGEGGGYKQLMNQPANQSANIIDLNNSIKHSLLEAAPLSV